jgi:hypothetical protein
MRIGDWLVKVGYRGYRKRMHGAASAVSFFSGSVDGDGDGVGDEGVL